MPGPKSGNAGTIVSPSTPREPEEADIADPGQVEKIKAEQRQNESGKYGAVKAKPFKPQDADSEDDVETTWVEIELIGEDDKPITGERYRITLPDGSIDQGTLDHQGRAKIEGISSPGDCKITFPDLDAEAWEPA